MAKFKYAFFYDFHTATTIPDVGRNFDVEKFTDELVKCKCDFLTWHARCNQGGAYYNTKIGTKHPALEYDMFGKIAESCRRKNIKISAYFNGALSDEELIEHPEWAMVHPDGRVLREELFNPYARTVCYNSPYREHLKNMVLEILEMHQVDGFFFDCLQVFPCICKHCMSEMKQLNYDITDIKALENFSNMSINRLCKYLNDAIKSVKPDALLFFNNPSFEDMDGMSSHIEVECLPTGNWGYDFLPTFAHYARTVAREDQTVLNMTGRFYDWSDFGGLRTPISLEYDYLYGMSQGMRPCFAGHFHPRGDMNMPIFDLAKKVFSKLQKYDNWTLEAKNLSEIAVVYPKDILQIRRNTAIKSCVRMLEELKMQFDVVTEFSSWENYELLIFPDDVEFSVETENRVNAHLAKGKKIIVTGNSGTRDNQFVINDFPVEYLNKTTYDPIYFSPKGALANNLPNMPLSIYSTAVDTKILPNGTVEMPLIKPYMNHGWDGIRSNYYAPPQEEIESPFIARTQNIIYCSGNLFEGYWKYAAIDLRMLLKNMISYLLPHPKFYSPTLPTFAKVAIQEKSNSELIHIIAYVAERKCNSQAVEDEITVVDSKLFLRLDDNRSVKSVKTVPEERELVYKIDNNYIEITLPMFKSYTLIEVQY